MTGKRYSLLAVHAAVVLFGFAGLFGKFLDLPPMIIVLGRTFFGACALGLFFLVTGTKIRLRSIKHLGVFIFLGFVLATHWTTFFHSIQISTVAVGLLTFSTFPIFVTFMEPYFFKERIHSIDIVTAFLVLCGLVLVVPEFDFDHQVTKGAFWGVVSGFTFAVLSIMNRRYVSFYASTVIAFYENAFATLFLLPFLARMPDSLPLNDFLKLLFLGVFCTALAHGLFIWGLKTIRAQLASITACLEPVYGIFFAFVILGEIPAPRTALGGVLIVGTLIFASAQAKAIPLDSQNHGSGGNQMPL